ncbi:MAG: amino acid ABC transporter permease [Oscillospiraceae bacterium]
MADLSFWERVVRILTDSGASILQGCLFTLVLALIGTLAGCLIGFAVGIVQTIPVAKTDPLPKRVIVKVVNWILTAYVEFFRGTPMIVQSMFFFYGIAMLIPSFAPTLGSLKGIWIVSILVVSINTGAYMAETVRGGILSIDPGQSEGAKAIGMTHVQTMLYIIFPQTLRNIMPQIGNNLIINIKDTSVLFVIGFTELFSRAKAIAGALYVYFETYTIIMIVYFIMTFTCSRLLRMWERRLDGPSSYDLATKDTLAHTSGMHSYQKGNKTGKGAKR